MAEVPVSFNVLPLASKFSSGVPIFFVVLHLPHHRRIALPDIGIPAGNLRR